jgi:hypothetical protein
VVLTVHATHRELEEAAGRPDHAWLRAWARAGGVELQSPRSWSRGAATDEQLATLLSHELAHCVLFQALAAGGGPAREAPLWFAEGMASAGAGERWADAVEDDLWRAYRGDAAGGEPPRDPLVRAAAMVRDDADLVYGAADLAFRALVARHGDERLRLLVALLAGGRPFPDAFRIATGIPLREFEGAFRRWVVRRHGGAEAAPLAGAAGLRRPGSLAAAAVTGEGAVIRHGGGAVAIATRAGASAASGAAGALSPAAHALQSHAAPLR